jgi:hypothetical protein
LLAISTQSSTYVLPLQNVNTEAPEHWCASAGVSNIIKEKTITFKTTAVITSNMKQQRFTNINDLPENSYTLKSMGRYPILFSID